MSLLSHKSSFLRIGISDSAPDGSNSSAQDCLSSLSRGCAFLFLLWCFPLPLLLPLCLILRGLYPLFLLLHHPFFHLLCFLLHHHLFIAIFYSSSTSSSSSCSCPSGIVIVYLLLHFLLCCFLPPPPHHLLCCFLILPLRRCHNLFVVRHRLLLFHAHLLRSIFFWLFFLFFFLFVMFTSYVIVFVIFIVIVFFFLFVSFFFLVALVSLWSSSSSSTHLLFPCTLPSIFPLMRHPPAAVAIVNEHRSPPCRTTATSVSAQTPRPLRYTHTDYSATSN